MRIDFHGRLETEKKSEQVLSMRFTLVSQYLSYFSIAPVNLAAVCDLDEEKAGALPESSGQAGTTPTTAKCCKRRSDAVLLLQMKTKASYPKLGGLFKGRCHDGSKASHPPVQKLLMHGERSGTVMVGLKKMFFLQMKKQENLLAHRLWRHIPTSPVSQHIPTGGI